MSSHWARKESLPPYHYPHDCFHEHVVAIQEMVGEIRRGDTGIAAQW